MVRPEYECCKCKGTWWQHSGIADPCPNCGSLYVKWLNYDEFPKYKEEESTNE